MLFGGIAAGVRNDVDERVVCVGPIDRLPEADRLQIVFGEQLGHFVPKLCFQFRYFSGDGMIDAKFEYAITVGANVNHLRKPGSQQRSGDERNRGESTSIPSGEFHGLESYQSARPHANHRGSQGDAAGSLDRAGIFCKPESRVWLQIQGRNEWQPTCLFTFEEWQ